MKAEETYIYLGTEGVRVDQIAGWKAWPEIGEPQGTEVLLLSGKSITFALMPEDFLHRLIAVKRGEL